MKTYIVGKPRTRKELEEIFEHDQIVFVDSVEEYREHALNGTKPTMVIIDELVDESPTDRRNVGFIGHLDRGKHNLVALIALLANLGLQDRVVIADGGFPAEKDLLKAIDFDMPEPVEINYTGGRRSKGDKHRNRRHRWSGQ